MRSSNQSRRTLCPSKGLFHSGLLRAEPEGRLGVQQVCGGRSPDKERGALDEFFPQILPELFGIFLFAVYSFHKEHRVVHPRVLVYVSHARHRKSDRIHGNTHIAREQSGRSVSGDDLEPDVKLCGISIRDAPHRPVRPFRSSRGRMDGKATYPRLYPRAPGPTCLRRGR